MEQLLSSLSLTTLLICITVGISLYAWRNRQVMDKLILNPYQVSKHNEYWRFLTSGFIHADYGHLFFNMFALYSFGEFMEAIFHQIGGLNGDFYFLLLYLGGIIVSDIPSYLKNKKDSRYNSLGASGGVSSIVFGSILFAPTNKMLIYGIIPIPAILFAVLYVWYSIYMSRRNMDNVNHSAHLYGGLWGIICCTLIYPQVWSIFILQLINWQ